jgi:MarR family transcriptional regulator, 2-MHQ and catechol-resistance regulon repressor
MPEHVKTSAKGSSTAPSGGRPGTSGPPKTQTAFAAYLDLMDTAEWFRERMSRQLGSFGLSMPQFRVLELLYHGGPTFARVLAERLQCTATNIITVVNGLEERGLVRRDASLPMGKVQDKRIVPLRLTPEGEKLIARVFGAHAKVVRARMRVLQGREQQKLGAMCRKLREGDPVKFLKEMMWEDVEEN